MNRKVKLRSYKCKICKRIFRAEYRFEYEPNRFRRENWKFTKQWWRCVCNKHWRYQSQIILK